MKEITRISNEKGGGHYDLSRFMNNSKEENEAQDDGNKHMQKGKYKWFNWNTYLFDSENYIDFLEMNKTRAFFKSTGPITYNKITKAPTDKDMAFIFELEKISPETPSSVRTQEANWGGCGKHIGYVIYGVSRDLRQSYQIVKDKLIFEKAEDT